MPVCYICLVKNKEKFVDLVCNHSFHSQCLARIRKPVCPLCRTDITSMGNILQSIKKNECQDIAIRSLEHELAAALVQLEEYDSMIIKIIIPLVKTK
uniref:RING-type domain-containing protein n=1 Tax=viral metagenome TaxID=1070528 RepID=A0A6C0JRV8_9ZZZZ